MPQTHHESQAEYCHSAKAASPARTIILEFIGGSWDGRNLSNDTMDPKELELAATVYLATCNGAPGMQFALPRDYATALTPLISRDGGGEHCGDVEVFRVADCIEFDDEVLVRLEYAGNDPG